METLTNIIYTHAEWAPVIIFGALVLGGLNIPVSEDLMIFVAALLATRFPDRLPTLFAAIFAGAYLGDLICYSIGRYLGNRLWDHPFFGRPKSRALVEKIRSFYMQYGAATLVFGRFIPFGFRNGLLLAAGVGNMPFRRFALADLLACMITCTTFFSLYYWFGEAVIETIKEANVILFAVVVLGIIILLWRKNRRV